jgi:hypothetical protein
MNYKTFSILVLVFLLGILAGVFYPSNGKTSTQIHKEITLIYKDRIKVRDSIIYKQGKIKEKHEKEIVYVDSSFKYGTDKEKISLFNKYYPALDTNKLMIIVESQAKKAIETAIDKSKDSAMYVEEKKSRENCDSSLEKVVTKVDTLIQIKTVENKKSFWLGLGIGFVGGFVTNSVATTAINKY